MNTLKRSLASSARQARRSSDRWSGPWGTLSLGRRSLFRADRPRAIDRYIDYFGEGPTRPARGERGADSADDESRAGPLRTAGAPPRSRTPAAPDR